MTNAEIAQAFEKIGQILRLQDANPFRVRAYDKAAQTISSMTDDVTALYKKEGMDAINALDGIGKDLASKIEEMVTTGKLAYLTELKAQIPEGLLDIPDIQGMGPKKTAFVWKEFGVTNIDELEALAKSGKLDDQKGWGAKSIENILIGIESLRQHSGRVALPVAYAIAEEIVAELKESKLCSQIEIAGSLRRRKETIGDVDILVASDQPEKVKELFINFHLVDRVLAQGPTKASVHLSTGLNVDLRVVDADVFGAALHYFTGSKEHNIRIRSLSNDLGLTISEYGVYKGSAKEKGELVASKTEEDLFEAVGLHYIPPELREDRGEIDAAQRGMLPVLIEEADLQGDLHMHSNFSDGSASMIEMAEKANSKGYSYIAITDHASVMGMVQGIKDHNIDEFLSLIEQARKAVPDVHIFAGAEVDILEDGSLFLSEEQRSKLDWVALSVHGNFNLSSDAMTKRILTALDQPHVHMFAHPTSRLLLKRDPITYDIDAVFKKAAAKNIALEINASPSRLDLNDVLARRAKEAGAKICINCDAHHPRDINPIYGIMQARRGWLEKDDVLNTLSLSQFNVFLKKRA